MSIRIVTDSTCDLPVEVIRSNKISVAPLLITTGEQSFSDGVDLSRQEFYARLPNQYPAPTTAAQSPAFFQQIYEDLADKGAKAILSIHISERLSTTINSARMAATQFTRIPVSVLDSGQLSLGLGFLVEQAAEMANHGHSMEDILTGLQETMKRTYVFASLKTLEYLRRSGRMHFALARLGEILQIKVLLHMNQGNPTAHRTRTQNHATERLIEWLKEYAPFERLAVLHAGIQKEAEAMRDHIKDFFPDGDIPVVQITPVLGAHLGIGALGFACIAQKDR